MSKSLTKAASRGDKNLLPYHFFFLLQFIELPFCIYRNYNCSSHSGAKAKNVEDDLGNSKVMVITWRISQSFY